MADGDINGFDDEDTARIGRTVRAYEHDLLRPKKQRRYSGPTGIPVAEGRLTTAITAATDGRVEATSFTFRQWSSGDGEGGELTESDTDTTGYNRSNVLVASVDSFVVCIRVNGEWRPVYTEEICA
jgi:hypothetical protein